MVGVIDNDYRGEIKVILRNESNESFTVPIDKPISQLLLIPYTKIPSKKVNNLSESKRGT